MNKQKGNSTIAIIAIVAIAAMVGIWIAAESGILEIESEQMSAKQIMNSNAQVETHKDAKMMDDAMMMKAEVTSDDAMMKDEVMSDDAMMTKEDAMMEDDKMMKDEA